MVKILVVFGTRPEAIKMAPVIRALEDNFVVKICVTAQHRKMLDQVIELFEFTPDYDLDIMQPGQDLFDITCNVMSGVKKVLKIPLYSNEVIYKNEGDQVKDGDEISLQQESQNIPMIIQTLSSNERDVPEYLQLEISKCLGKFIRGPQLTDVPYPVQMEPNLVVEFYSR